MKKFLAMIASIGLIVPSALSVVSCGPKISENVLLVLPGLSMSSASKITRSYQQIVEDFNNSEEMKDSKVKVEAAWENGDAVQQRASGMEQLPDLYVAYPDLASKYILDPAKTDDARNMGQTYKGLQENHPKPKPGETDSSIITDDDNDEILKRNFWAKSFYEEGLISTSPKSKVAKGEEKAPDLYVLPLIKSFDMSVVNLKVFLELASFVLSTEEISQLGLVLGGISPSELFQPPATVSLKFEVNDETKMLLKTIAKSQDKSEAHELLREFFQNGNNILQMAGLYAELYQNHLSSNIARYTGVSGNLQKMYSVGIDSTSNQIFMNYADKTLKRLEEQAIKENNATKFLGDQAPAINPYHVEDFFYHIEAMNPNSERMDVVLDAPTDETFSEINRYFNTFRDLTKPANRDNGDPTLRWAGSLMIGRIDNKTYTTNYFNQGTMLVSSSSTAGSWSLAPSDRANPQFNKDKDLLVVSSPTMSGNYQNFIQQGPGLAGFKSVGKNKIAKEGVTTKFLQYLLQPKVQNKLAIMSGYIPSTTEALEMYKYYKDGSFDNQTGQWSSEFDLVELPNGLKKTDFEQIAEPRQNKFSDQRDEVLSQLLKDYAKKDDIKMNVITTSANPAGALLRDSIESALRNYVFKTLLDFDTLLQDNRKYKATIVAQFRDLLPGSLSSSKIRVRK